MSIPIGVLYVGESAVDARAVEGALRAGGFLPSVNRCVAAEIDLALGRDLVEVAIVDFDLAGSEALVSHVASPSRDLPCIVIGSSPNVDDAARAIRAGAHEYLLKADLSRLPLTVEREVREKKQRTRRARAERSLAASTERLLLETRAQVQAFRALHEAAKESGGYMDPIKLAEISVEGARKLLGTDAVSLYWFDESQQRLNRLAVGIASKPGQAASGSGIAMLAFRQRSPVVLDGDRLAVVAPSVSALGFGAAYGVPLLSNERVVGAMVAGVLADRVPAGNTLELLELFAQQVGPSLEANFLAAERDLQVRRLEALQRVAVAAGGLLDPAELGRLAAEQARDLTDGWSAALLWVMPEGDLVALHDNHPVALSSQPRVPREGATGLALESGNPVLIDDYLNWPAAADWAVKGGIASVLAVPLMVRDVALGCLVVRSRGQHHFRDDHVRILSLLAAQVGPALEGARQARLREEQADTFRALHEIAVASGGLLDPGRLAKLAVGNACELLGADGAVVFEWDEQAGLLQPVAESESSSSEPACRPGEGAIGVAFERCEPVIVDDYATFDKVVASSAARGMVSAAAVPLVVDDRPIGALGVWTYSPRRFKSSEVQVLRLFAAQLAPALEASRHAQQREVQAHAFRALHELAVVAGGVLEPAPLAELAIATACDLLAASSAVLVRYEAESDSLVALADNHPELGSEPMDPRADGATGLSYRERTPVAIEDYATWEHAKPSAVERGVRSVLSVPILVHDVVVGCLCVRWNQPRKISGQDAQLLGLLAAEVGPSMEAARVAEEREVRARTFASLHDLAVAVGGVLDPAALSAMTIQHARDLLDTDSSTLVWWDEESGRFSILAENHPALGTATGYTRDSAGVVDIAFQTGEPVAIRDYQQSPMAVTWARRLGIASVLVVPLLADGRPVGCLGVRTDTIREFSPADIQLLRLLAAQVAPAIHAAHLHRDLGESEQSFRALHELGLAASGILEPAALAETGARTAQKLLGVDSAGVLCLDEENQTLRVLADTRPDIMAGVAIPFAGPGAAKLSRGEALVLDDYRSWEGASEAAIRRGVMSAVIVPLHARDRVIGTLGVQSLVNRHFTPAEVELLTLIAASIGPAIDAARLHSDLLESQLLMSSIVNGALDCVIATDQQGRVVEFNPAAERVFGYAREEALGRNGLDLVLSPQVREAHRTALLEYVDSNGDINENRLETVGIRSDGTEFPMEISVSMVERNGETLFSASIRDLSVREQALTATRESEAKSRFLASMSHELRTPLNSILGFAQLLGTATTGQLNERQKRYLGHIESSGRHLLALITDVLDLSKVAAGQMEVDVDDVDVNHLVGEAMARVAPLADPKSVQLALTPSPGLWVRADSRRLLQVFLNLLSNAIKFTLPGGNVTITTRRVGHEVEIAVADTGIGISDDRQEWIFEEFTQVQAGALDTQEGTGLGLALSRRLLTLMDGSIRLESEVGRGSVFTVTLPRSVRRRDRPELAAGSPDTVGGLPADEPAGVPNG